MAKDTEIQRFDDDVIDLGLVTRRIKGAARWIAGLACLGVLVGGLLAFCLFLFGSVTTSTRVSFTFPGFEKGEYPDGSRFNPDDIRAPDVIADAMSKMGVAVTPDQFQEVDSGIAISPIISADMAKERDRLRGQGVAVSQMVADEYEVTLTLRRGFPLDNPLRERLVREIASAYRAKFVAQYISWPKGLGNAFDVLAAADYQDYQIILSDEMQHLQSYLAGQALKAPSFRSSRTGQTFGDLASETSLFQQTALTALLSRISNNAISKDREAALESLTFRIQSQQAALLEDQANVQFLHSLLDSVGKRPQDYALAAKVQDQGASTVQNPVVDKELLGIMVENDSYNLLVKRLIDANGALQDLTTRMNALIDFRKKLQDASPSKGEELQKDLERRLVNFRNQYNALVNRIRQQQEDFATSTYANAVSISDQVRTETVYRSLVVDGVIGAIFGLFAGLALALLWDGSQPGRKA